MQKLMLIIFGMFLCVALLEAGLRFAGGVVFMFFRNQQADIYINKSNCEYRIMCIGESTTFFGGEDSYPTQLKRILNENTGIRFQVINRGTPGATSAIILSKLNEDLEKYKPNMVIVMIGANDFRGTFAYKDTLYSKIRIFLGQFRIYKLTRLIWWHLENKIDAIKIYNLKEKKIQKLKPLISSSNDKNNEHYSSKELVVEKIKSEDEKKDYVRLGDVYSSQRLYGEAELMFKKAIAVNPEDCDAYAALANLYMLEARFEESKSILQKAIEINPNNGRMYLTYGNLYNMLGLYNESELIFKKALKANPENHTVCNGLGESYLNQGRYKEAEEMFNKAVEEYPEDSWGYIWLGNLFSMQERYKEAEVLLNKAMQIDQNNFEIYTPLAYCLMHNNQHAQAEEVLKRALRLAPGELRAELTRALISCYDQQRKNTELNRMYGAFVCNYLRIKEIITERGIRLVCVQYPVRSIEPLKKMFDSTDGVIFVDNEKVFKDALKNAKYSDYFIDNFGGDFGHCTPLGNRLLAENIANVILREVLHK